MLKSSQVWAGVIVTRDATGALATPSVGPAGTLFVNGVSNAASVTVTGTNPYKWSVTLPALTAGDICSMYITATISSVATAAVVAEDTADTKRVSDLNDAAAAPSAATVASQVRTELTTELGRIDAAVSTRSTYAGGAVASVTGAVGSVTSPVTAGTVSDKTGYALTAAYDAAKTAAAPGASMVAGSLASQAQTDVQTALTGQGYTTTRAGYLDNLVTIVNRLGAFTGSGVNTVLGMLKALGSKSASTPSDMGGTYDATTDSQEAAIDNAVGGVTPAQLWSYAARTLTQSASQVTAAVSGSDITILRGDRVTVNLTGIGSLTGRTKLWITVKASASQADSEAIIQAEETAGLIYLNGASYATATDSVITVTDAATGALTWVLKEAATRQLAAPIAGMVYDIQILTANGVLTRSTGLVNTTADVTRAVS